MNQIKEEHLKERNGCACRPPCEFCYGSETKEEWNEERISRIKERLDNAKEYNWTGGFEDEFFLDFIRSILKESEQRVAREIVGKHNANILNAYQDEYLMKLGPGCEEILWKPLEKATEETLATFIKR